MNSLPLSVIIPTYNRLDVLKMCLESIGQQTLSPDRFEVLIINDSSSEEYHSHLQELAKAQKFNVKVIKNRSKGPASARNYGVELSKGKIILFLNDDVILNEIHLQEHLKVHSENENVAVRGKTIWHPDCLSTNLMKWLSKVFFVYHPDMNKNNCTFIYFHTCDLSIGRHWFEKEKFDEDFPYAAYEDTEFGYRLEKKYGLRLVFCESAVSQHHHFYNLRDHIRRAKINGISGAVFSKKHPELNYRVVDLFLKMPQREKLKKILGLMLRFKINTEEFYSLIYDYFYARALLRHLNR